MSAAEAAPKPAMVIEITEAKVLANDRRMVSSSQLDARFDDSYYG
jgi:hypothetical protein